MNRTGSASHHRRALALGLCALTLLASGGCDNARHLEEARQPLRVEERHPITVAEAVARLELPVVAPRDARFSIETTRFVRAFVRESRGTLTVAVPGYSADTEAVGTHTRLIHRVLAREGVPPRRVRWRAASGSHVVLAYERVVAIGPECGDWSEDVTFNPQRRPYPNFGCASQRNLAAMAANPTDVEFPAREEPRLGDRRSVPYKTFATTPPAGTQTGSISASR